MSIGTRPPFGHYVAGQLAGANFFRGYDTLSAVEGERAARVLVYSRDAFEWWLEDQPIFERLGSSGYLALSGTATASLTDANGTLSGSLNGSFSYCPTSHIDSAHPDWPPTCTVPAVTCESSNHQVTFVPR